MTLAEKLHAIQTLARKAPKRGKNQERAGREYDYLMIEDAVHLAKQHMRRHKLILTPTLATSLNSGYSMKRHDERVLDLIFEWTLEDIESGEKRFYAIPGTGWDLYDKSAGKAMTNSRKNAIILIFNLEVGNDVEDSQSARDKQKEVAKQTLEKANGERYESLEHAEASTMDREQEAAAIKNSMVITWPEAHNGHRFLLKGRRIAPTAMHKEIEVCEGKWSDREMGWFIASAHYDHIHGAIQKFNLPLIDYGKR